MDSSVLLKISFKRHSFENKELYVMALDNYGQYPPTGQGEGAPGQPSVPNGNASGQSADQSGAPQMQFPVPDGQGMASPTPGQDGKTTLWYAMAMMQQT